MLEEITPVLSIKLHRVQHAVQEHGLEIHAVVPRLADLFRDRSVCCLIRHVLGYQRIGGAA